MSLALIHWYHRLRYWQTMFTGSSYYHQPQGMGTLFVAGALQGYFNDLTAKVKWTGDVDGEGLPLLKTTTGGKPVYFPILLCQKALGHWDRFLAHGSIEDRQAFLKIACWLRDHQDAKGGWDTWGVIGREREYRYSAMTQGQSLSVMARAHQLTGEIEFERSCRSAMALLQRPVQDEGVCWYEAGSVFLEEFPGRGRDTVLNGWVFSLFGVYDYLLRFTDAAAGKFYAETLTSLVRSLTEYDAGYWSYYSNRTKRLASPFYHHLHISQLTALRQVTEEMAIQATMDRWVLYKQKRSYQLRAVVFKGLQKLREPDVIPITE